MKRPRERLLELKEGLQAQIASHRKGGLGSPQTRSLGELSSYDNHPADDGSATYEREKDLGIMGNAHLILDKVEEALRRLDQGMYGICDSCGRRISPGRLEAVPYTTLCADCKAEQDALPDRFHRPIEEAALYPPFGRSFRDRSGVPAYDGEDAWQDVAFYGTANTPQDIPGSRSYERLYERGREKKGYVEEVERLVDDEGDVIGEAEDDNLRRR